MKMKDKAAARILSIIGIVITLGIILSIILSGTNRNKGNGAATNINLPELKIGETLTYKSKECGITFSYPAEWKISDNKLPLGKTPLEMTLFDAPLNNEETLRSVLAFMCFDKEEVKFADLYSETENKSKKERIGNFTWLRVDSFAYTEKAGKLIVFQMNNTK